MRKFEHKLNPSITQKVNHAVLTVFPVLLGKSDGDPSSEELPFSLTYQASSYLSKYVSEMTDTAETRRHRAIVKWLGVELRNRRTNTRLFTTDPVFNGIGSGWVILTRAAKLVKRVIGTTPPADLLVDGSFSGGASTSRRRAPEILPSKFMGSLDSTPAAWPLFEAALGSFSVWTDLNPQVQTPQMKIGNVLFTVPKSAVIDRVAAKEPDVNIFCQKSVGNFIRSRLKSRVRIDLNDQSINRSLARRGSIDGSLATLDLSSASDSLTISLVNALLPTDWFTLLSALRSPTTIIDKHLHVNEMFSSMGNGFTFELESLVFWALALATCQLSKHSGRVSVYGDDIIIPTGIAAGFCHVLNWCGFTVNETKSFIKGPFRESCGGHYYRGLDMTPFYHRKPIKTVSDLILYLNQLRAWIIRCEADAHETGWERPNRFVRFWTDLAGYVPKVLWGGVLVDSRTQLASLGKQQCELVSRPIRKLRLEEQYQTGMYLQCLNAIDQSPFRESVSQSTIVVTNDDYRLRRCKVNPRDFGLYVPRFLTEQ